MKKEDRVSGPLNVVEIEESKTEMIKETQRRYFAEEYDKLSKNQKVGISSKLIKLNPRLDTEGVMRSDSRLKYFEFLPYDTKYPVLLPRKSPVTELIVKDAHEKNNHSGTNQTLSDLSVKYWIVAAREQIRDWENKCSECKRRKGHPKDQIMAPLPKVRTRVTMRAFSNVAVDFGGLYITIQGRGTRRAKRYLCLFTCLSTRAVHLEIAFGLDTNAFLNAFYRMVNRRGLPVSVYSDNGTNFVGADKELRELVQNVDKDKIKESAANRGIQWFFNPPVAPHWGGVHEIMIKSAKRAISAILTSADISDEELITACTGAESLINSRPLTYQSANVDDCTPLTPNHFLFGQVGGQFAPDSVDDTDYSPIKRWRRVQELVKHLWKRWLREFLPMLAGRKKWFQQYRDFRIGVVVLVVDPEQPRGRWPLGRIVEIFPGDDGHVRAVSVRIGQSVLKRSITRLCLIVPEEED
ncbi:uncharacterized protein LOC127835894 [Dreissena polymorpha]|uniref:uncharacterized protein LOC127835894 n=1 Tax=Dreissena polymorpha TaxID=45954 RepID=UPI002263BD42|nr:uncharacterized protein LOC127835894 [Dreissena polymorpha]